VVQRGHHPAIWNCGNCHRQEWSKPPNILPANWWSVRLQTATEGVRNFATFCSLRCLASGVVKELASRSRVDL
jgi:hypothetical protein